MELLYDVHKSLGVFEDWIISNNIVKEILNITFSSSKAITTLFKVHAHSVALDITRRNLGFFWQA